MEGIDQCVYSTTLCTLMLTVYYRYLPSSIMRKDKSLHGKNVVRGVMTPEAKAKKQAQKVGEESVDIF